jgi:cell division protein FtsW (lipid II flippase)
MQRYRSVRDFDWSLLLVTLLIAAIGVFQIYSATRGTKFEDVWWKQIVWIGLGLALMWLAASIDYHTLLGHVPLFYVGSVSALLLTVAVGKRVFGSRRWISLGGGVNLQISEFAKIVIILLVARYLAELRRDEVTFGEIFKLAIYVGIPALLVMRQPDLGTALTYLAILGAGILLAGLDWKQLVAIVLLCGFAVPVAWPFLNDYQKRRLETFVNPNADPRGAGYQVIQSRIAVGHRGGAGDADAVGLSAGRAHRLYFFRIRRRTRLRGRYISTELVFSADHADCAECTGRAGSVRHVSLYGSCSSPALPLIGECGDGDREYAGDRDSSAAYELWRFARVFGLYDVGVGEQRAVAPIRQLAAPA